jgi:glycosyltransferase involved in cell wall biosynthesis
MQLVSVARIERFPSPEIGMSRTLVVIPSVRAVSDGDRIFADRKAIDGLMLYARLWPGPVRCLMRAGTREEIGYGQSFASADLPFDLHLVPDDLQESAALLKDSALCLAAGDNHLDFKAVGIAPKTVFIIEYTLATRLQIVALESPSLVQSIKSGLWTIATEASRRRAFKQAAGLQCNGKPAFDNYRTSTPALLYYDTRMGRAQQITADRLADKQQAVRAGRPLRLAFSGRLERMKGADQLIAVASALHRQGTAFTFQIYGDGSLRAGMEQRIGELGLSHAVTFHGPVDFSATLVPALIETVDLFVCCHRQADPSCTYLETLSCGVPIVGYDNAAFKGVLGLGDVGRMVPMNKPDAVAKAVAILDKDRETLATMMAAASAVGSEHSFETVFSDRIAHLRGIAGV